MQFTPYLNFDGNCAEAFAFYAKLFGGTDGRAILHDGTQNLQLAKVQHLPVSVLSA